MIRIIGSFFIFCGCFGLGYRYKRHLGERIATLRLLQDILAMFESEISYGREPLPDCCRRLAARVPQPFSGAFERIAGRMDANSGEQFGHVFQEEWKAVLKETPVKREDAEDFFRSIPEVSFSDYRMQMTMLEQSREVLKKKSEQLTSESREKSKIALCLGAMSGLMLLLILC